MECFSALPRELWYMTVEECDRPTLVSLARVSSFFQESAQRTLYREIDRVLAAPEDKKSTQNPELQPTPWIELLLRTLLERPELSRYIRRVRWSTLPERRYSPHSVQSLVGVPKRQKDVDPALVEMAMKLVEEKELFADSDWDWTKTWDAALHEGNIDAMVALVLAQCNSLISLELSPVLLYRSRFLGLTFKRLSSSNAKYNHFRHLRHVAFCERDKGHEAAGVGPGVDQKITLIRTRRIETLELTMHDHHLPAISDDLLSVHESLTTLRLWFCNLGTDEVGRMLKFTPALKVLRCGFVRSNSEFQSYNTIRFAAFGDSLRKVANTLEELTIELAWAFTTSYQSTYAYPRFSGGSLGSLQFLHSLLHLEVPVGILNGPRPWADNWLPRLLPRNLQSLVLIDVCPYPNDATFMETHSIRHTIAQLIAYLKGRSLYAPCLRKVTVKLTVPNNPFISTRYPRSMPQWLHYKQIDDLQSIMITSGIAIDVIFMNYLHHPEEGESLWQRKLVL